MDNYDLLHLVVENLIYKDADGNYYATRYMKDIHWVTCRAGEWIWHALDKKPSEKSLRSVGDEEKKSILINYSPVGELEKLEKSEEQAKLARLNNLRKTTQRKVIGWDYDCNIGQYYEADYDSEDYTAALVNAIAEFKDDLCGAEMDMIPVFDDYRTMELSARGWGRMVALAHGEAGDMAYCGYAWGSAKEFFKPEYNPPEVKVLISDADYKGIEKVIRAGKESDFFRFFVEASLDKDMPLTQFERGDVFVQNKDTREVFKCFEARISTYKTLKQFDNALKRRNIKYDSPAWLADEISTIRKKLEGSPVAVAEIEISIK